jgi:voltage-gated potassium channel Kch
MIANLALATFMVGLTVLIHVSGLFILIHALRRTSRHLHDRSGVLPQVAAVLVLVLGVVATHTVEIWAYAVVYLAVGALPDLEAALYFSITSFTTLGYGDVVLDRQWRVFGAIEGANGLILFGWSTAFLFSITSRMRTLEHEWPKAPARK